MSDSKKQGSTSISSKIHDFLSRFIDGFIAALKISNDSNLFLGLFICLEGFCLLLAPIYFPVCVAIGTILGLTFAIELVFDIAQRKRKIRNAIQQICIIVLLILLGVFLFLLINDDKFSLYFDRLTVSITTIADGVKNIINTIKIEKRPWPLFVFIVFSLIYINYGIIYIFLGRDMTDYFNTTMHGVVFIMCGLTNLWFYHLTPLDERQHKTVKSEIQKNSN